MIKSLQSLRGVTAILIFYHHFGFNSSITDSFGDFGVAFFMMLSGFVLTLAYTKKIGKDNDSLPTIRNFMMTRIIKIYPIYLMFWGAAAILTHGYASKTGLMLSLFMLQSWLPVRDFYFAGNAVSWFICDLIFCYLIFIPLLRLMVQRRVVARVICTIYFVLYFSVVLLLPEQFVHGIIYINPLMQVSTFIIGICLFHLYSFLQQYDVISRIPNAATTTIEILAIGLTVLFMCFYGDVEQRFSFASYWWLPVAIIILTFSIFDKTQGYLSRLVHRKWLILLGNISMSFYMIHALAIQIWHRLAHLFVLSEGTLSMLIQSVILLCLLIPVSILIDKHFVAPINKKLQTRISI